jgi:hypothetical protein
MLKRIALLCVLLPVLALAAWYTIAFLPHLASVKASSARGLAALGDAGRLLAEAHASPREMRTWAVRQSYATAHPQGPRNGMGVWHANNLLWYGASFIHFSNAEIRGVWTDCAIGPCGQGLPSAAQRYLGKSLHAVSPHEMAALVAYTRHPARNMPVADAPPR